MVGFAYERVAAGEGVPGFIVTTNEQSIGSAIEDILLIAECMPAEEISAQVVVYLPLRDWVLPLRQPPGITTELPNKMVAADVLPV